MATAAMIFNGLRLDESVVARGFAHAKQSKNQLIAIFLKAALQKEAYGFPSDLGLAERLTTDKDADLDDSNIIEDNIRLLEHQARATHIELHTVLLEHPTAERLKAVLKNTELIFIRGRDEHGIDTPAGTDVQNLLKELEIPIEIVQ